jgi:response regulator RpfG family c-di-GMP phosphodiesterase
MYQAKSYYLSDEEEIIREVQEVKANILIVDDQEGNRKLLDVLLKEQGYTTHMAASGIEALAAVAEDPPDLLLLDVMMPGMDGFQVAERLKSDPTTRSIPIITVTSLEDRISRLRGLKAGAEDFLSKPIDRAELSVRVRNLLRLKAYGDLLANYNRVLEERVLERTARLRGSYLETIYTLTRAAEYKDNETGAHVRRISFYTKTLAERLGLDAAFVETIFYTTWKVIGKNGWMEEDKRGEIEKDRVEPCCRLFGCRRSLRRGWKALERSFVVRKDLNISAGLLRA